MAGVTDAVLYADLAVVNGSLAPLVWNARPRRGANRYLAYVFSTKVVVTLLGALTFLGVFRDIEPVFFFNQLAPGEPGATTLSTRGTGTAARGASASRATRCRASRARRARCW